MGVSRLTAMIIATNYPDDIMVAAGIDEGLKWAGFIYQMRDGEIHSLQVSTTNVFDTEDEAKLQMHKLCKGLQEWYTKEKEASNG